MSIQRRESPWTNINDFEHILQNERLFLRPAKIQDLPLIKSWWKDRTSSLYFNRRKTFSDKERIKAIEDATIPECSHETGNAPTPRGPDEIPLIIQSTPSRGLPRPVGLVVISGIDWERCEASFRVYIHWQYRRRRYAIDALMLVIEFLFVKLRFKKFRAQTISNLNDKSEAFIAGLGFSEVRRRKKYVKRGELRFDLVDFEMGRTDALDSVKKYKDTGRAALMQGQRALLEISVE